MSLKVISFFVFLILLQNESCIRQKTYEDTSITKDRIVEHSAIEAMLVDTLTITLSAPVNTGYRWSFIEGQNIKLIYPDSSSLMRREIGVNKDGGYGRQVFKLLPLKKGNTFAAFRFKRPFGKDNSNDSLSIFPIVVK
ncbi:protease inhibitor I42 family protein [Dyadobacter bucti]|uniref:protease inhibitor I42 family protein n=1 Tax=Dyadobacter bucti TaxID=2572203 RepID=UPI001108A5FF|nr:protease inhibitor I42 family protein [Dyadobacter bucti]